MNLTPDFLVSLSIAIGQEFMEAAKARNAELFAEVFAYAGLIIDKAQKQGFNMEDFKKTCLYFASVAMAASAKESDPNKESRRIFTTGEAAEVCKVSQQTIIRCFDAGRLGGFRVPGSKFRRIPLKDLLQFMKDNGIAADHPILQETHSEFVAKVQDKLESCGLKPMAACLRNLKPVETDGVPLITFISKRVLERV